MPVIVTRKEIMAGLRDLHLDGVPVIIHASLKSIGQVGGGATALVNALADSFPAVITPAFTYKTMVTPMLGPSDNGITYASQQDGNRMAEFFRPDMPADPLMGIVPETLRLDPRADRSSHPILSFAGIHARHTLAAQTIDEPFAPLGLLEKAGGWVLLIGVDHTVNTSIHYAEKLAGRRTFIRWALTPKGIVECPSFPGCSQGFEALAPDIEKSVRRAQIGNALVTAVPLGELFTAVISGIKKDPLALLCRQADCPRCNQVCSSLSTGR